MTDRNRPPLANDLGLLLELSLARALLTRRITHSPDVRHRLALRLILAAYRDALTILNPPQDPAHKEFPE